MKPDPLIDEIRAIRQRISEEHGNDVGRLCDYLKTVEEQYADRVIRELPRTPPRVSESAEQSE